ncbi:hypothetical protein HRbin29_00856 [bacterium HR29]|nr:hypothetical protein HRbin29_00856 [bacterium HR29]
MLFDAVFVGLFVLGWLACGLLAWLAGSVATRGNAGLATLPLAALAGVTGGLIVPFAGFTGGGGLAASFAAAASLAGLVTFARIISRTGRGP